MTINYNVGHNDKKNKAGNYTAYAGFSENPHKGADNKFGSITKLMGFRIPHIINSAHINEF